MSIEQKSVKSYLDDEFISFSSVHVEVVGIINNPSLMYDFIKVYTKKYKSILYQIENLEHRKLHLQLAHMNVFNEFTHRQFITKWRVKK